MKIEIFLLKRANEGSWKGSETSKTLLRLFNQQKKINFLNRMANKWQSTNIVLSNEYAFVTIVILSIVIQNSNFHTLFNFHMPFHTKLIALKDLGIKSLFGSTLTRCIEQQRISYVVEQQQLAHGFWTIDRLAPMKILTSLLLVMTVKTMTVMCLPLNAGTVAEIMARKTRLKTQNKSWKKCTFSLLSNHKY